MDNYIKLNEDRWDNVNNDYTEPLIDACKVNIIVPKPLESADQPPTFTRLLTGINHYKLLKL